MPPKSEGTKIEFLKQFSFVFEANIASRVNPLLGEGSNQCCPDILKISDMNPDSTWICM